MTIEKIDKSTVYCRSCNTVVNKYTSIRKGFPLYIWPLPKEETTRLDDVLLYVCDHCGHMQLQKMDQEFISQIYRDKAFNIENFDQNISRYKILTKGNLNLFDNTKVLEIGGGRNSFTGVLPIESEKWGADFSVDEDVSLNLKGKFIGDFLDLEIREKDFDYIFMFHVLEHFNHPGLALEKIKKLLKERGKLIIEVPNFSVESEQIPYYTLFHMHISLFTKESLISFLGRYGFTCNNFYINDSVLLAEFCFDDNASNAKINTNSLAQVHNLENNIRRYHLILKKKFKDVRSGSVAIFGAGGATTLFLFNFPFLIDKISCALDNDKNKIGRFLCNGKIPIIHPGDIDRNTVDYIIVLNNNHIGLMVDNTFKYISIEKL